MFYMEVCDFIWVDIFVWCEGWTQAHISVYTDYQIALAPFIEKTVVFFCSKSLSLI